MMNTQQMSGAQILQEYTEVIMKLVEDRANKQLQRRAIDLEDELNRRMAW